MIHAENDVVSINYAGIILMSSLIKELFVDLAHNRLDIDTRVTLLSALEQLCLSNVFTRNDIVLLDMYLQGFSAEEIGIQQFLSTETVINILSRLCIAVEFHSGYLDQQLLDRWSIKYTSQQIQRAKIFLEKHSKEFTYENVGNSSL